MCTQKKKVFNKGRCNRFFSTGRKIGHHGCRYAHGYEQSIVIDYRPDSSHARRTKPHRPKYVNQRLLPRWW